MPVTEIKRPNYYEGQYLGAADMAAAQEYQRQQDQRHRLGAHTWGIAVGLELEERLQPGSGDAVDVYIKPGYGWEGFGAAIVVLEPKKIDESLFARFRYSAALPAGEWVPVWLRYRENKTNPAPPGFVICDLEDQSYRILETCDVVVGDLPSVAQQRDQISVAGKSLDAAAEIPDASVPYQAFPDDADPGRWLIRLGSVRWLAPNPPTTTTGHFVKSQTNAEKENTREGRSYIGVVAQTVLAPAGKLRIKDRSQITQVANETTDLAGVEGSLRVDDILSVKKDAYISNNVGIGTTAPAGRLTISGMVQPLQGELTFFSQDADFVYDGGSDKAFIFKDTGGKTAFLGGNVGIGTEAPASKLHLNLPASSGPISAMSLDVQSFGDLANAKKSHYLQVRDIGAPSTIFFIRGDGNIGIGTATPGGKLTISGLVQPQQGSLTIFSEEADFVYDGGSDKAFIFKDTGGKTAFLGGNVGIGTEVPASKLEVVGDLRVTGGNVFVDGHLIPIAVPVDVVAGEFILNQAGNGSGIETISVASRLASVSDAEIILALASIGNINEAFSAEWTVQKQSKTRTSNNSFDFGVKWIVGDSDGWLYSFSWMVIFVP